MSHTGLVSDQVQESSDSCDSETTVTSHPSQDVATPLALDQPQFVLPDCPQQPAGPDGAAEADVRSDSVDGGGANGGSEEVLQYSAHQLPINRPAETPEESPGDEGQVQGSSSGTDTLSQNTTGAEQEDAQDLPDSKQNPQDSEDERDSEAAAEVVDGVDGNPGEFAVGPGTLNYPVSSSPVLSALERAKQQQLSRANVQQGPERGRGRARGRGLFHMQRSTSLPSSLLSPSRVVSSIRIQFGRGQASCTKPRFFFRYTEADDGGGNDRKGEVEMAERELEREASSLPTMTTNPAASSSSNDPAGLPSEAPLQPKAASRHPLRSSQSLHSASPPPDWSLGGPPHVWSTQSYPDLTAVTPQQQLQQQQNTAQPQGNPAPMFPHPSPYPNTPGPYFNPSSSPRLTPSPFPVPTNPPLQYPTPAHLYASLPNLFSYNNPSHHSSLSSLQHQSPGLHPHPHLHHSLSNLHQPAVPAHHASLGNLHPGMPLSHLQGYGHLHGLQSPYNSTPLGPQAASLYHGFQGYNPNHSLAFPHQLPPYPTAPPMAPEHILHHPGPTSSIPAFPSNFSPAHNLHLGHSPVQSSTETQLRKVLQDIRGTVQSLNQVGSPYRKSC